MTETPDQARTRRRWITLAEAVAVAGVLIGALTLYLSWSEKREERADRAAAARSEKRAASVITLRATRSKGGDRLDLGDAAHPVDSIDVAFPTALEVPARSGLVKPAIDREWIERAVLDLSNDQRSGRVPVLITSTFWEGADKHIDRAIYDVAWTRDAGGLGGLLGDGIKLEGMSLRERSGGQARLDAIWTAIAPQPKKD